MAGQQDGEHGQADEPGGAPAVDGSPGTSQALYVLPALTNPTNALAAGVYSARWRRLLQEAGIPNAGTHGIRHRAAMDIANSGVPI